MSTLPTLPSAAAAQRPPMPDARAAAAHLPADQVDDSIDQELAALNTLAEANSIMLCSINPKEHISRMYTHGGRLKQYKIAAGSMEKPAYTRILSTYQVIQSTTQVDPNERPDMVPMATSARDIVKDLLQEWGGDHPASRAGGVGIFICKSSQATHEELMEARRSFEARNRSIVNNTDIAYADPTRRNNIRFTEARAALEWLGDKDHHRHPWFTEIVQTEFRLCPACGTDVKTIAHICPTCRTNIAIHMKERGVAPVKGSWDGVEKELEFLAKAAAALERS